jgi:integrase
MARKRKHRPDLPNRVYFRHGSYYFVDKASKWHPLGRDYMEAMIAYAQLNSAASLVQSLSQVIDRYQREVVPTKAPRTQQDNLRELALLRHAFGHMRPGDITPQDIYAYMDARKAPIRANREKSLLSHIFGYAIRWGIVADNPCRLVKRNPERPRTRYVSDDEFWAVHGIAAPAIQCAMVIAWLTGLRQGDILSLRFSDLTPEGLEITTSKTGKRLVFEWTPELEAVVKQAKALPRQVRSLYLICNNRGQRYTSSGFRVMWQRSQRQALEKGIIASRYTFHDLRAKAGSEAEDGQLLGHMDQRTLHRHYQRRTLRVVPIRPKVIDRPDLLQE